MNYASIIEFVRANKKSIIEEMKAKIALDFMESVNYSKDNDSDLLNLKVESAAMNRVDEILETVIEKLEQGANYGSE